MLALSDVDVEPDAELLLLALDEDDCELEAEPDAERDCELDLEADLLLVSELD